MHVSVWQLYQTFSWGQWLLSAFVCVHKEHAWTKRGQISSVTHWSLPFKCYFQRLPVTATSAGQMDLLGLLWTIRPLAWLLSLSVRPGAKVNMKRRSYFVQYFQFFFVINVLLPVLVSSKCHRANAWILLGPCRSNFKYSLHVQSWKWKERQREHECPVSDTKETSLRWFFFSLLEGWSYLRGNLICSLTLSHILCSLV